jgi:hypothetical protein
VCAALGLSLAGVPAVKALSLSAEPAQIAKAVLVKVWPLAVDACDPVLRAESCAEERSAEWVGSRAVVARGQADARDLFVGTFVVRHGQWEKLHYAVAAVIEAAVQQRPDDRGCPESMPIRFVRGLCGRAADPGSYRSVW